MQRKKDSLVWTEINRYRALIRSDFDRAFNPKTLNCIDPNYGNRLSLWGYQGFCLLRREIRRYDTTAARRHETLRTETAEFKYLGAPPVFVCCCDRWENSKSEWGLYLEHDTNVKSLRKLKGNLNQETRRHLQYTMIDALKELHADGITHVGIHEEHLLYLPSAPAKIWFLNNDRVRWEDWSDEGRLHDLRSFYEEFHSEDENAFVRPLDWPRILQRYLAPEGWEARRLAQKAGIFGSLPEHVSQGERQYYNWDKARFQRCIRKKFIKHYRNQIHTESKRI
jgi:hypothetical protein